MSALLQSFKRKPFFIGNRLRSTDSLSIRVVSRPAGLLPFFGKVQLTSVGVFLYGCREARTHGV